MKKRFDTAGDEFAAGYEMARRIKKHVKSTDRPEMMDSTGSFGRMFDLASLGYREPVLVSGTEGVGAKLKIAFTMAKHDTIGIDAVAVCVNNVIAKGAEPLFFLDYVAVGKNQPAKIDSIVEGVAEGCRQAGCTLIGGETAEIAGVYKNGEYDVAGFSTGVVEKSKIIDGAKTAEGDILIGIASSGIHSSGCSLIREIISETKLSYFDAIPELGGRTLGEELLTPTRIYVKPVLDVIRKYDVHAVINIAEGGIETSAGKMLGDNLGIELNEGTWKIPPIFNLLEKWGRIPHEDMYTAFNMGIGMILAVDPSEAGKVATTLKEHREKAAVIGTVTSTPGLSIK